MVLLLEFVLQELVLSEQFVNAKGKVRLPKNSSAISVLLVFPVLVWESHSVIP